MVKVGVAEAPKRVFSAEELKVLDTDGDGDIDVEDLQKLVKVQHAQEKLIRLQKYGILFLSLVVCGVGFGLGYELKVANAETGKAIEDARVGGTTAHVIEAPSELQVESRRRRDGEGNASTPQDFVNKDNQPVRTDRSMDKLKLTSELPDDVFSELERLKVEGPTGSINFKVQGFARFSAKDASRCGSVVIVYTTMGHVQFDGTSMLFGGDVAGAFERAGFRVSNQRRRRRSVGQGRNRREVDDVNYSLIGVNRMFGEFNFIKKVDLSSLSCGDERPTIKAPFDGDVYDIQVEEDNLILCGSEPGMSPCPGAQDVVDGLNGDTYFKRRTQMRAKKMPNGVWRTIRSTAFPEMDADSSLPEEYRGGRFVELSNGEDGESYQYWPKTEPMLADDGAVLVPALREVAVTSSCQTGIPTDDNSATINANSADVAKATFTIDFIGFDVLNNHYVKHFKLHEGGYNASKPDGIDYFESFDLNRMYAIGVFGNGAYNTYESIKTNEEVDKDFLQGDGYPDLDAATFAQHIPTSEAEYTASNGYEPSAQCTDEVAYASITEENLNGADPLTTTQIAVVRAERVALAKIPNLEEWLSFPFDFDEYQEQALRTEADYMMALDSLFPDDDGCMTEGYCTSDRQRRAAPSEQTMKLFEQSDREFQESILDANNVTDPALREQFHAQLYSHPDQARSRRADCPSWARKEEAYNFVKVKNGNAQASMGMTGSHCIYPPKASVSYQIDVGGKVWDVPFPGLKITAGGFGVLIIQRTAPVLTVILNAQVHASFHGQNLMVFVQAKYEATPKWWPAAHKKKHGGHSLQLSGGGSYSSFMSIITIEGKITFTFKDKTIAGLKAKVPRKPQSVKFSVKGCFASTICVGPINVRIKTGKK